MEKEYYTLEQAARALGIHHDEVIYLLESRKLKAHLYTISKSFILLEKVDSEGGLVGRGLVQYSGLLQCAQLYTRPLAHGEVVTISRPVILRDFEGIVRFSQRHSFEDESFLEASSFLSVVKWAPWEWEDVVRSDLLLALPKMVRELNPQQMLARFQSDPPWDHDGSLKGYDASKYFAYSYSFSKHGTFTSDDLRIHHEDLEEFSESRHSSSDSQRSPVMPPEHPRIRKRERDNEFHRLVEKIISYDPNAGIHQVWSILRSEVSSSTRRFDEDEILLSIDSDKLYWRSRWDNKRQQKRSSLASLLSDMKKELAVNKKS